MASTGEASWADNSGNLTPAAAPAVPAHRRQMVGHIPHRIGERQRQRVGIVR